MIVAIPFNIAMTSKRRLIGLDSYFWPFLAERYRIVLLVQPIGALKEEANNASCMLPSKVSIDEQLRELEEIARLRMGAIRVEGGLTTTITTLVGLIAPMAPREPQVRVPEGLQASILAKALLSLKPRPLGKKYWLIARWEKGRLAFEDPRVRRNYGLLLARDRGYREALVRLRSRCSRY